MTRGLSELPGSIARNSVASSVRCRRVIDFHHAKAHVRAVERRATDDALMETLDGPSFGRRRRSDGRQDPRGERGAQGAWVHAKLRGMGVLNLSGEALLRRIAPKHVEGHDITLCIALILPVDERQQRPFSLQLARTTRDTSRGLSCSSRLEQNPLGEEP